MACDLYLIIYATSFMYISIFVVHIPSLSILCTCKNGKMYQYVMRHLNMSCPQSSYPVPSHGTQFYCIETRSNTTYPLISQLCKYITCISVDISCNTCIASKRTMYCKVTSICSLACSIAKSFVHAILQLLGPLCLLPVCTLSI